MKGNLWLFVFALAPGLTADLAGQQPGPAFYTEDELTEVLKGVFAGWPGDKSEKLVFIAEDGQVIVIGNRDPKRVTTTILDIVKALARKGQHLGTITNVIHNHERKVAINEKDMAACKVLRKAGFKGRFQVYYPESWRLKTLWREGQA